MNLSMFRIGLGFINSKLQRSDMSVSATNSKVLKSKLRRSGMLKKIIIELLKIYEMNFADKFFLNWYW